MWARIPKKKWSNPHSQQKNPKCSICVQPQKWQNDLCSFPRQTIWHHSNPSLCPNHWRWRSWSWSVLWRSTRLPRTNIKNKTSYSSQGNAKVGSQEIARETGKFSLGVQNEAGQRLTEFCQENTQVIANTLFNNTRDSCPHGHHQMVNTELWLRSLQPKKEKLYTVSKNKTWSWLWFISLAPYSKNQS